MSYNMYIYICIYMYHNGNIVDNMCFFCRSVLLTFRLRVLKFFEVFGPPNPAASRVVLATRQSLQAGPPWKPWRCLYPSYIIENNDDCIIVSLYYCMK